VDCPRDLVLHGVPGVLTQVFTNLCTNALSHAYADGARGGTVQISAQRAGSSVEVRFKDDGAGISADNVAKVFEPFYTTNRHRGGSGLGLYIVYSLMTQSLGGSIECHSKPEQGTMFTLRFPYVAATQPGDGS
jgi:signal transduction histidine kinase